MSWVGGWGSGNRVNSKGRGCGAADHAPVRGVAREPRLERLRVCQAVNGSARGAMNEARVQKRAILGVGVDIGQKLVHELGAVGLYLRPLLRRAL